MNDERADSEGEKCVISLPDPRAKKCSMVFLDHQSWWFAELYGTFLDDTRRPNSRYWEYFAPPSLAGET